MPTIEGSRFRTGAAAGVSGDTTGYGLYVYSGTAGGGTPDATFQPGTAEAGALTIATATPTPKLFMNTGTKATPAWTVVGAQS